MRLYIICLLLFFTHSLKTSKNIKRSKPFKFFIIGDQGDFTQRSHLHQNLKYMNEHKNASFIMTTGDNFYPNGISDWNYGNIDLFLSYLKQYDNLQGLHVNPVLGNHDCYGDPSLQYKHTRQNPQSNWRMYDDYYHVDYKNQKGDQVILSVLYLDACLLTCYVDECDNFCLQGQIYYPTCQKMNIKMNSQLAQQHYKWIQQKLKVLKGTWKAVVMHWSMMTHNQFGDYINLNKYLKPLLIEGGIDFIFSGHSHNANHHMSQTNLNQSNFIVQGKFISEEKCERQLFYNDVLKDNNKLIVKKGQFLHQLCDGRGSLDQLDKICTEQISSGKLMFADSTSNGYSVMSLTKDRAVYRFYKKAQIQYELQILNQS